MLAAQVVEPERHVYTVWNDPNPFKRRNELWVELEPPEGDEWWDHGAKIATDIPAKNSSLYSLKDLPWAVPSAFAGACAPLAAGGPGIEWKASTAIFQADNTLALSLPRRQGAALALDKSSDGELSLSWMGALGDEEDLRQALYAVAPVEAGVRVGVGGGGGGRGRGGKEVWALSGAAVGVAREALVEELGREGAYVPADPLCFRLLVTAPGRAELWMMVYSAGKSGGGSDIKP